MRLLILLLVSAVGLGADATAPTAPVATAGASTSSATASGAVLSITVDGMHSALGHLRMALFNQPTGFPEGVAHACATANLPIATDATHRTVVTFPGLQPGTYAVVCFHDENDNNHFDKSWLGVPEEGWAVSNNIRPTLRAPTFQEACFTVKNADLALAVTIRY